MGRRGAGEASRREIERAAKDMVMMGVGEAAIARFRASHAKALDDRFAVHPANTDAVRLFLDGQTQWRMVAVAGLSKAAFVRTGLIYTSMEVQARAREIAWTGDLLDRLRLMEGEALEAWAEAGGR